MLVLGWAGSNSGVFKTWNLKEIEVVKVELPARNAYVHACIDRTLLGRYKYEVNTMQSIPHLKVM